MPEQKETLKLFPNGATGPFVFMAHCYCGQAKDSVGIYYPTGMAHADGSPLLHACTLFREDVIKLRKFLEKAEAEWDLNPPDILSVLRQQPK